MEIIQLEYQRLLKVFNRLRVDYAVIGCFALIHHGVSRQIGDLEVYVRPNSDNAERVLSALSSLGFSSVGLRKEVFELQDQVIQFGVLPSRINLVTSIAGVPWEDVELGRTRGSFGDLEVSYLGRNELLRNLRSLGKKSDFDELQAAEAR